MALTITSLQNPRVKHAVRLRERKAREREGLMLVEGYAELALALEAGLRLEVLFICPELFGAETQAALAAQVEKCGAELIEVTRPVFEKIAYRESPDGWLALAPSIRRRLEELAPGPSPLVVVAESIEKPGNLGAILRSADAAGADGLIVCDPRTDLSNPNVVRSSKGTLFSVPVAEASSAETLRWLRERGIALLAATPQATTLYTEVDLRGPIALAVGAEKEGLSLALIDAADIAVRIPMHGRVNSLNVATATSLLLYEALRQRA